MKSGYKNEDLRVPDTKIEYFKDKIGNFENPETTLKLCGGLNGYLTNIEDPTEYNDYDNYYYEDPEKPYFNDLIHEKTISYKDQYDKWIDSRLNDPDDDLSQENGDFECNDSNKFNKFDYDSKFENLNFDEMTDLDKFIFLMLVHATNIVSSGK
jgi:hypothetical protein